MMSYFHGLDHLAIAVRNTEEALSFYRDQLGLRVLFSEELSDQPLRLTHLDLGNTQLQLVEPLAEDHPVAKWLQEYGEGLHHFCLKVDDVQQMVATPPNGLPLRQPGEGPQGRAAAFFEGDAVRGQRIEITSDPAAASGASDE